MELGLKIKSKVRPDGVVEFWAQGHPGITHNVELSHGESAADYNQQANEAIEAMILHQLAKSGKDFVPYVPSQEEIYLERALAVPRIMAAWASYNAKKLESGEWKSQDFASFMMEISPVVILLNSLAFGATKNAIMGFAHPLADSQAKADYIKLMDAEI